jgi:sporulation protein YlmC with PRC-barrel domain
VIVYLVLPAVNQTAHWSCSTTRRNKCLEKAFLTTFQIKKEISMIKPAIAVAALMACSVPVLAATDYPSANMQTTLPSEAMTVTDWYKQNVYDPNENKIGDIKDVLVDKSGKVVALIVGVGGFLGAGEKDVAVPFEAVHPTMKDKKWWLVMNTTKDSLKSAPGFKYDSTATTWVPDKR